MNIPVAVSLDEGQIIFTNKINSIELRMSNDDLFEHELFIICDNTTFTVDHYEIDFFLRQFPRETFKNSEDLLMIYECGIKHFTELLNLADTFDTNSEFIYMNPQLKNSLHPMAITFLEQLLNKKVL